MQHTAVTFFFYITLLGKSVKHDTNADLYTSVSPHSWNAGENTLVRVFPLTILACRRQGNQTTNLEISDETAQRCFKHLFFKAKWKMHHLGMYSRHQTNQQLCHSLGNIQTQNLPDTPTPAHNIATHDWQGGLDKLKVQLINNHTGCHFLNDSNLKHELLTFYSHFLLKIHSVKNVCLRIMLIWSTSRQLSLAGQMVAMVMVTKRHITSMQSLM